MSDRLGAASNDFISCKELASLRSWDHLNTPLSDKGNKMKKSWSESEFLSLFCNRKTAGLTFCVLCGVTFLVFSSVIVTRTNWAAFGYVSFPPPAGLASWSEAVSTVQPPVFNVTLVTAFIDIGEFGKGAPNKKRDHRIYKTWSAGYSRIMSPVVFYTDSEDFAQHFLTVRQNMLSITKVIRVNRSELWSFGLRERIAAIYAGGYPKHWPNTVNPDYTCVTHAKFDLVLDTLSKGYFASHYVAWMDVGYLRTISGKASAFYTMLPSSEFDSKRVLCGEVYTPNFNTPWRTIFRQNINWVAGGFFLATPDIMKIFVEQYRKAVTSFLQLHESQVEQHVIYAMYTEEGRSIVHPTVELQTEHGDWFDVGLSCLIRVNSTGALSPAD